MGNEPMPIAVMFPIRQNFLLLELHLHNLTIVCQSKGPDVKFYYWSCDLTEHIRFLIGSFFCSM